MKRSSKEYFIAKSLKRHGEGVYDYSRVDYVNAKTKVWIRCIKHDFWFEQTPDAHSGGKGCAKCAIEATKAKQRKPEEVFWKECFDAHGSYYDYSVSKYVNHATKMRIICPVHGEFEQLSGAHARGLGCRWCGYEKTADNNALDTEKWVALATKQYGNLYNYSRVKYVRAQQEVSIGCNTCGDWFEMRPNNHTSGKQGCPSCASYGYNKSLEGRVYVLSCGDITKVGITNRATATRAKNISKSSGKDFKVVRSWTFYNGADARRIEQKTLKELRGLYNNPPEKFDGSSECFIGVTAEQIINFVSNKIMEDCK